MAFDDTLKDESIEPHEEVFSHQDALILVVCVLCGAQLALFGVASCWRLLQRILGLGADVEVRSAVADEQDDGALLSDKEDAPKLLLLEPELELPRVEEQESVPEIVEQQNALIRLCHIRFLVLAEKLKQELNSEDDGSAVGEMIASLPVSQLDREDVRLADIVQVLAQIPLKERGLSTERIENQIAAIQQDLSATSTDMSGAWQRLQELYVSFQSIQRTIQTRKRAQSRQASRAMSLDGVGVRDTSSSELSGNSESSSSRTSCSASSSMVSSSSGGFSNREPYASEVLSELERVSRTLPQGFTADMFSSLGQAIRYQTSSPPQFLPKTTATTTVRELKRKAKRD